jgi:hypothetical protein
LSASVQTEGLEVQQPRATPWVYMEKIMQPVRLLEKLARRVKYTNFRKNKKLTSPKPIVEAVKFCFVAI